MRTLLIVMLAGVLALMMTGCFPGTGTGTPDDRAGFFTGVWHGWIAPLSLIVGIFKADVRLYEVNNTGWWYDLGFYIAVIAGFGGLALSRKRERKH
jgi:hypothetical protein